MPSGCACSWPRLIPRRPSRTWTFRVSAVYLEPNDISGRELAGKLGVAASTLSRVLNGGSRISPEMALRLSKALGRSPESWLAMQDAHDLWVARRHVDLKNVRRLELVA